jgi:hypothetical protein
MIGDHAKDNMRNAACLLVLFGALWQAETARGQVPRIPVFRPPPVARPPVRVGGPAVSHVVPIPHAATGDRARRWGGSVHDDQVLLWILAGVILLVFAVLLWVLWKYNRGAVTAASGAELPPDLTQSAKEVAAKTRETEQLLTALGGISPRR